MASQDHPAFSFSHLVDEHDRFIVGNDWINERFPAETSLLRTKSIYKFFQDKN